MAHFPRNNKHSPHCIMRPYLGLGGWCGFMLGMGIMEIMGRDFPVSLVMAFAGGILLFVSLNPEPYSSFRFIFHYPNINPIYYGMPYIPPT